MDEPVLTLVLRVDAGYQPNQNTPPAWRIYLKDALSEIERTLLPTQAAAWRAIHNRLDAIMQRYEPSGKTLVLFINADSEQRYDLPIALDHQHQFGPPMLVPLLWAVDEHERYLITLVDREEARFISTFLGQAAEVDELTLDIDEYDFREKNYVNNQGSGGRAGGDGSSRDHYDDMIAAHEHRFYKQVAGQIADHLRQLGAHRIIMGGNTQSAHAVQAALPETLQGQVVDIVQMPMQTPAHEVSHHIQEAAVAYERAQEEALVEAVINLARADGRGALGREAVAQALTMRQVEVLVIARTQDEREQNEFLSLKTLEQGGTVEIVHGTAAELLRQHGGVAARLRYTLT